MTATFPANVEIRTLQKACRRTASLVNLKSSDSASIVWPDTPTLPPSTPPMLARSNSQVEKATVVRLKTVRKVKSFSKGLNSSLRQSTLPTLCHPDEIQLVQEMNDLLKDLMVELDGGVSQGGGSGVEPLIIGPPPKSPLPLLQQNSLRINLSKKRLGQLANPNLVSISTN